MNEATGDLVAKEGLVFRRGGTDFVFVRISKVPDDKMVWDYYEDGFRLRGSNGPNSLAEFERCAKLARNCSAKTKLGIVPNVPGYCVVPKAAERIVPVKPPALPTEDKDRKVLPVFTGPLMYFPHALLEVARVCKVGNDQHNPGQPMHWAREKSTDQMNTALRHMMDHGLGNQKDTDGTYHLAKAAWRILAELELAVERDLAAK